MHLDRPLTYEHTPYQQIRLWTVVILNYICNKRVSRRSHDVLSNVIVTYIQCKFQPLKTTEIVHINIDSERLENAPWQEVMGS